jgi:hypothetical protein
VCLVSSGAGGYPAERYNDKGKRLGPDGEFRPEYVSGRLWRYGGAALSSC